NTKWGQRRRWGLFGAGFGEGSSPGGFVPPPRRGAGGRGRRRCPAPGGSKAVPGGTRPPVTQSCGASSPGDDLNLASLDAEAILEAEEILGTMQNYLDSSVISIIEDLSLSESKACLDAQNELSLLTAITEILDSTDDETLSPFDTMMDAELLTSPRERDNPSFQKFLSLSRPALECESPAPEHPKGLRPPSRGGSVPLSGKVSRGELEVAVPKEQKETRSDGEEEEEEAASSPELDSSVEAAGLCASGAEVVPEEHEDPCIINTGDVSLSELVKSMHPYCLPTFTVCLDPEAEPVAKELLSGPVLLEIVPGEGESVEIPVVLQPLAPGFPGTEPQLLGAEDSGEPVPEHPEELPGEPAQEKGTEEEKEPGQEPSNCAPESKAPAEAVGAGGKRQGCEKGRGRERARKSRKKKAEEGLSEEPRAGRDCVAHRLRSGRPRRAARPSPQVSDFLERQLERAKEEGGMELRAQRAPRPRGRPRGAKKEHPEPLKELEAETSSVEPEKGETVEVLGKVLEEPQAAPQPSPEERDEGEGTAQAGGEVVEAAPEQGTGTEPPQSLAVTEPSESLPREAKPKALSLREYRMRMQHRQPSPGGRKEGEKQAASKWPSVPEPPTELADIPCLVAPICPAPEAPGVQKSPEKPPSPLAVPPPASKPPPAPAPAPAPASAPPPPPVGCHGMPPPPTAGAPGAFHMVPGLPPPPMAWPPPALPPPPPFGPYGPPVGWAPPSYWPGIPIPPPVPPLAYGDPGAALQATAPPAFPAAAPPGTALLHGQPPVAPTPSCPEPPAFPVQPSPSTETGGAGGQPRQAASRVSDPRRQARLAGESPLPKAPQAAPAAAQPNRVPPAPPQPSEEPPAAAPQPAKPPQVVTPSPMEVSAAAGPAAGSPGTHPTEEAKGAVEKPPEEPPGHKSPPQAAVPPQKPCREGSLPTKPPAARLSRHQPLVSPAQPSDSSKDIVRAFISEIGIEATDLSSLLEQFEKSEGADAVRCPLQGPLCVPGLVAPCGGALSWGLTPPATPPHQLWKPLPAVSLLAKTKSPIPAPQEGSQRTAKLLAKAKPLPQSKLPGRIPAPPPSHVCSGDHDYCIPGTARPEGSSSSSTQPPGTESGSRWNVKHHRDITIKPISSLTKRTQEPPGAASPAPLDYRTSVPSEAAAGCSSPPTSVLLSPAASPCRDQELRPPSAQPGRAAAKRSLRCYRRPRDSPSPSASSWRAGRSRASRSFSSSSDGASESSSSSSSSSSRSRSRSLSPPHKRWRSSSSRSSCGSYGRSRDRSSSSSSSSSYSSRSPSRRQSRSRSPSPRRRSNRRRRYSYDAQDHYQRQRILQKERAIEERRVVFIGKIPSRMTRSELRHRFSVFGDIEECTLHFRSEGDNYGFVTYRYAEEAFAAIESGHKLRRPDEQPFDLCFGGRRQFCRRNYADLDSNREDFDPAPVKSKFDSLDFDTLLRQAQRSLRR
uniref:Peroxisome proliferator-activated receptor gamma coactivator-related protein 1 n=1 Tax=Anas zonorhyncha TaxID=75864 RepID=A0A8B9U9Z2_9AVES